MVLCSSFLLRGISVIDQYVGVPSDEPSDLLRKRAMLLFCLGGLTTSLPGLGLLNDDVVHWRMVVSACMGLVAVIPGLVHLLQRRKATDVFCSAVIYFACVSIFLSDLNTADASISRAWPLFVVALDMLLVMQIDERVSLFLVFAVLLWLALTQAETAVRFGLFDLPGGYPQDERRKQMCGCETIPCPQAPSKTAANWVLMSFVFAFDFLMTRHFAKEMQRRQERLEGTLDTAKELARSLARLDLEWAERVLREREAGMSREMHRTFQHIVKNLQTFQPYLPDALFDDMIAKWYETESQSSGGAAGTWAGAQRTHPGEFKPPPGLLATSRSTIANPLAASVERPRQNVTGGVTTAAIVFTEIIGAGGAWTAVPDLMKVTLRVHNRLVREAIRQCTGEEVRAIGESFMIAFKSAGDAVTFGVKVQQSVQRCADWPDGLCAHFGGAAPAVRVAVAYGDVVFESNPVNGRVEYYGKTVACAARLETVCGTGGCVLATEHVVRALASGGAESIDDHHFAGGIQGVTYLLPAVNRNDGRGGGGVGGADHREACVAFRLGDASLQVASVSVSMEASQSASPTPIYVVLPAAMKGTEAEAERVREARGMLGGRGALEEAEREKRLVLHHEQLEVKEPVGNPRHGSVFHPATVARIEMFAYDSLREDPLQEWTASGSTSNSSTSASASVTASASASETQGTDKNSNGVTLEELISKGHLDSFLGLLLTSLERTEGKVVSLSSTSVYVGWNTSFKCQRHLENSFHFIYLIDSWRQDLLAKNNVLLGVHAGVSNGSVYCGTVGTKTQRFVTVIGECLKVVEHLCLTAACVRAVCLFASLDSSQVEELQHCLLPFKRSELLPIPARFPEMIYELLPSAIAYRTFDRTAAGRRPPQAFPTHAGDPGEPDCRSPLSSGGASHPASPGFSQGTDSHASSSEVQQP